MGKITDGFQAVLSFQRGEERGFEYFFNKLWNPLCKYAYSFLNDEDNAKDMVEFAFIKIWNKRDDFNKTTHPAVIERWLYVVVKNRCLYFIRFKKNYIQIEDSESSVSQIESIETSLIRHEFFKAKLESVHNAIATLPKKRQNIIRMLFIEQLSVKQVAEKLNLSISTVKSQKINAIDSIRKYLGIPEELINAKYERWVKGIYFSRGSGSGTIKMFGSNPNTFLLIKKGALHKSITKDL